MRQVTSSADVNDARFFELEKMQEQLDVLRARLVEASNEEEASAEHELEAHKVARLVRAVLRSRRKRDTIFGQALFGEPAWDMLLELYVAERLGRNLSISGLCYSSAVPATTALRWIDRLEREGWLARKADELDRRRYWVFLTERGSAAMLKYFRSVEVRPV